MADTDPTRRFILAVDPPSPPEGLARPVLAIGNFDGIHRGHKAVIERAKALAEAHGRPCAVLTFEPHPSDFFGGPGTIFRLTPLEAKARFLESLGLDGMVVLTFDAALATLPAEEFVARILVERLCVSAAVVGYDFHFGKARGGTPAFLEVAGRVHGFEVVVVERLDADGDGPIVAASSTTTRAALQRGDVASAAKLLGHPYAITGIVRPGQKLGRTLGFPTANLETDPSCRLRHGIYAVRAEVDGIMHDAVASYGRRPTVETAGRPLLEVFLFDFSGDLYGRTMEVDFIAWLRGEERFDGLEPLKAQMLRDVEDARNALKAAR